MATTTHSRSSRRALGLGADRAAQARLLAVLGGYALLLWALTIVLFYPNGWLPIWLAGGATVLLSFDRKLGPLPAALLVMLAMPVGRGSEVGLPRILGDVPVRAHDLVPLLGVILTVPAVVRRLRYPRAIHWRSVVPVAVFAAVGLLAIVIGLLGDQTMRDVIRDTRWWAFYAIGGLALLAGTPRSAVLRGILWGLTLYSVVILIGLLMPMFHGGLKYGAYAYDPRLRLHYGQAVLLLVAVAFVTDRVVRRPSPQFFLLLALLAAGIGVTLTRTLLSGVVGVGALTALWVALELTRRTGIGTWALARSVALRAAPAVLAVVIGVGAGFGVYHAGVQIWTPDWAYSTDTGGTGPRGSPNESRPVRPSLDRVFEDTANAGFEAQAGGRFTSYAYAFVDTAESPLIGHGIGQLARVPWAWGGFRAHTEGSQPAVDSAYLTIGLKAGAIGIAAFAAMLLWPLRAVMGSGRRRMRSWFVPAWLGLLGLTLIQSFAVSGYAPFALSLLVVLPALGLRRSRP
ncbi:MAG: hypothetical protein ACRDGD_01280 [Candidatus Limnocylindria bacterium]